MDPLLLHRILEAEFSVYGYCIGFVTREGNDLQHLAVSYLVRDRDGGREGLTIGYDENYLTLIAWQKSSRTLVLSYADPALLTSIRNLLAHNGPLFLFKKKPIYEIQPVIAFDPTRDSLTAM